LPSFETLVFVGVFALLAVAGLAVLVALRASGGTAAVEAFEAGRFEEASRLARSSPDAESQTLLAGARAARHLLDLEGASMLLEKLLQEDGDDGEAWVEKGLVAAYGRNLADARECFEKAVSLRSDLLESITLHQAWLELVLGEPSRARRLFDEVEATISTKLDIDLGGGDPGFAEWFLHAGWLWRSRGAEARAATAIETARDAAPESQLPDLLDSWASAASAEPADGSSPLSE
jgi:tetratricopeptide (TPR) repeat protein